MDTKQIIAAFNQPSPVPTQALDAAQAQKSELAPFFIERLKTIAKDPENVDFEEKSDVIGLYLLAQWQEKKAFPLILQLASMPEEWTEDFFGDIVAEGLARFIISTYDGNLQAIKDLIENKQASVWCRTAALSSLLGLFRLNHISREELIAYYRTLLTSDAVTDEVFATLLAYDVYRLYPQELYTELISVIETNGLETSSFGGKQEIDDALTLDKADFLKKEVYDCADLAPISDIEQEIEWLYSDREDGSECSQDDCECEGDFDVEDAEEIVD